MAYRAALFDFFGVICDERYWHWIGQHFPDYEQHRRHFQELADRADRGDGDMAERFEILSQEAGVPAASIRQDIYDSLRFHNAVLNIISKLKLTHKTGIVSNADAAELQQIVRSNHLAPLFDAVVISSEVGLIKPNRKIFEVACQRLGVEPAEAVFIDDSQSNVDGAQACGLEGVLYTNPDQLKQSLHKLGVL